MTVYVTVSIVTVEGVDSGMRVGFVADSTGYEGSVWVPFGVYVGKDKNPVVVDEYNAHIVPGGDLKLVTSLTPDMESVEKSEAKRVEAILQALS